MFDELNEVWEKCKYPNWDGYGAKAVELKTYQNTLALIKSLPSNLPMPLISAQPDGQLTLEWYKSPTQTFSISVDEGDFVQYGCLFRLEKHYGTISFNNHSIINFFIGKVNE